MHWKLSESVVFTRSRRVPPEDARRQQRTAAEILERLNHQPGVVLADEVGMGKTFVALAVAVSVVEATRRRRPIVVMVPRGVADKWRTEWDVFTSQCMKSPSGLRISEPLTSGSDFLKLLDDPADRRKHIVLLTHGAITSNLKDPFVKLSLLRQATKHRPLLLNQRGRISREASTLLRDQRFDSPELVQRLLRAPETEWKTIWDRTHPTKDPLSDDPVPDNLPQMVRDLDLSALRDAIAQIPKNRGASFDSRLSNARKALDESLRTVWHDALRRLDTKLPLLILDEAHHVKNQTQLADLLSSKEAAADLDSLRPGQLGSVFERMLFLTATPFQLGHHELLSVMSRFDGIKWETNRDRKDFGHKLDDLKNVLDSAQSRAIEFERAWSRIPLTEAEACATVSSFTDGLDASHHPTLMSALAVGHQASIATSRAEDLLRPWIIRHVRNRRRSYLPGGAIIGDRADIGLPIDDSASLPFLLAARAQALASLQKDTATVGNLYAYGLASSFEAYRSTRSDDSGTIVDEIAAPETGLSNRQLDWYVNQIDEALPTHDSSGWADHPKVKATVNKAVELTLDGHKVLIFCFYRKTGEALRQRISDEMRHRIYARAGRAFGLAPSDMTAIRASLQRLSDRLLRIDSPGYKRLHGEVLSLCGKLDESSAQLLADRVIRFMRTDSFLIRYTDISRDLTVDQLLDGFRSHGARGDTLRDRMKHFATYLSTLEPSERQQIFDELAEIMTGDIRGGWSEGQTATQLLPNVRLANGGVTPANRQRLMIAFNTPFFPDVLVASQVMSEGVNLHTYCRHVIHHDLDWNPASLEQRTGRVDRIGSLAEVLMTEIEVYEPYLAGTHDEKMFRVVKDRERWFGVVMGGSNPGDVTADDRVPLPEALLSKLTMRLSLSEGP
ncbi:helicase-related protein [Gordonia amicalis]|uniref:helicase-related protein n=1 Tax=Gordonia amicalis TaxID=89053 RepID=UPI0015F3DA78|nr:helicase-related protein [Gordonia amicalis]MBA5846864.1 hypothetical protein [Gordonia amicalis]